MQVGKEGGSGESVYQRNGHCGGDSRSSGRGRGRANGFHSEVLTL